MMCEAQLRQATSKIFNARIMYHFKINCHTSSHKIEAPHFFILSKGNNTGKPLRKPCPNCFVVITETEEEAQFYFWLTYALWQTGAYKPYLTGSVIPFIHIRNLRRILERSAEKALTNHEAYAKKLKAIQEVERKIQQFTDQLELMKQLKTAIFHKML